MFYAHHPVSFVLSLLSPSHLCPLARSKALRPLEDFALGEGAGGWQITPTHLGFSLEPL